VTGFIAGPDASAVVPDNFFADGKAEAGAVADVATARNWYQKARDWGSSDASKHLEALASMAR